MYFVTVDVHIHLNKQFYHCNIYWRANYDLVFFQHLRGIYVDEKEEASYAKRHSHIHIYEEWGNIHVLK